MEYRTLFQTFEIRFSDEFGVHSATCTPDILPDVLRQLMDEGKRIEQVNSKWM